MNVMDAPPLFESGFELPRPGDVRMARRKDILWAEVGDGLGHRDMVGDVEVDEPLLIIARCCTPCGLPAAFVMAPGSAAGWINLP